jgi:hypothetical protein
MDFGHTIEETVFNGNRPAASKIRNATAACAAVAFLFRAFWPAGMNRRHVARSDKVLRKCFHPVAS